MPSAYEFVESLHEGAAGGLPRALFFVPGMLTYDGLLIVDEDPFADFIKKLVRIHPKLGASLEGNAEAVVGLLIEHYNMMAVVSYEGTVSAYCRSKRNKMPTVALKALADNLNVFPSTKVGWFPNLDSDHEETLGATVFYGEAPRKVPKAPKTKAPKKESAKEVRTRFWAKGSTELPTLDDVDKIVGGGS